MKSQNKYLEFHKVGIIVILLISIMMFNSLNVVYAKTSIDYFIIENAYDDITSTCVYGDYIYILNDTALQKISLETSVVVDEINYPLLASVSEFMRKGNRIFFDATIDGARTIVAIDIETFKELAQVIRAEITPNFHKGLENIEYYDCNGHDFWVWAYGYCTASSRYFPNVFRGRYDAGSIDYEWTFISGCTLAESTASGNFYIVHYRYNATSDTVDNTQWDTGATTTSRTHWYRASIMYNHTSNAWESKTSDRVVKQNAMPGSTADDNLMNLQYNYDEIWLEVTWGEWGVRDNPWEEGTDSTGAGNNKPHVWLDTSDRSLWFYDWFVEQTTVYIARFDKISGFLPFISGNLLNATTFYNTVTWGQMALARLEDNQLNMRTWIGYVNKTGIFPKAERFLGVGGSDCLESGTIEFNGYAPTKSMVFTARKNIIAIFRNGTDTNNLYVCRNLIDRGLLGTNGYITPTLQFIDATLYTLVGNERVENDGWLFMGEIYQLEAEILNMTTYYLELDDGENTLRFYYKNETSSLSITESEQFLGGLIDSSIETVNETLRHYICTWTFILNRNIVDIQGVSITYYGVNEPEETDISGYAITGLNIYNLGGLTYYEFEGDGGKTPYGTPFELYATNGSLGSSARAEQIFRKLQSVHFLMELDMANEWDFGAGEYDIDAGVGYVDIGFDYRLDGSWVDGFKIRLFVQNADVGHHNGGNDQNWIEWSADFWNYNPDHDAVVNLKSQLIYSNHWGYEHENFEPDYHNRTSAQLWIDIWFDRTNASTTVATQVNSYYYGMSEQGSAWWFGYGTFQPMISDYDNAKFLDNLYDEDGEISNSQKIELVKFWIEVGKVNIEDGNDEKWSIKGIEDMNREQATDRMMGVDEPTFVQTKVLDMPQTGFINALKTAINNLSVTIWLGAFQFIKMLMASVGYLMNAIGLGVWWEAFSTMLGNIATASLAFMDELTIALINSALLIEQIYRVISTGVTRYVYLITAFFTSILAWYGYIIQMFSGGGIFNIDIWTSLNLEDIFILLMHLSPVWWLNRLNESDHFIETLQGDLRFMIMLVTGLFNFLASIIILTMTLMNILLGMLPI